MTQQTRTALKELQELDTKIQDAEDRVRAFDPLLAEVEEPALVLESEVGNTRKRLQEMKLEERRLELAVEEKGARSKKLEERLKSVRNLREEAAVSAELDMIKRALQSDEQEVYSLIDQIRKMEDRLEELEEAWEEAKEAVEPKRQELLSERQEVKDELESLRQRREDFVAELDPDEVRMYDGIRAGGRDVAVAELTADGACNHCFTMVPLQVQNEILHGPDLIRCEGCGVILSAPGPEEPEEDDEAQEAQGAQEAERAEEAEEAEEAEGPLPAAAGAEPEEAETGEDGEHEAEAEQPNGDTEDTEVEAQDADDADMGGAEVEVEDVADEDIEEAEVEAGHTADADTEDTEEKSAEA